MPSFANATHDPKRYIGMPSGTRCMRIVYVDRHTWLVWIATEDYKVGTYHVLHSDGMVERITARADEGDEIQVTRPAGD